MRLIRRPRAALAPANDPRNVAVAPRIRAQQCRRRKQVRISDAPFRRDPPDRRVVERQQRLPELRVLPPELARRRDVQPVVEQHELRAPRRRVSPDQDVAWVRIAVQPAEEEHLRAEKVDHRLHDVALAQPESVDARVLGRAGAAETLAGSGGEDGGDGCAVGVADPCVAAVWRSQDLPLADADAVDPLGDHDAAGRERVVHERDVDAVAQRGLRCHERPHAVRVGGLVEEVGLLPQPGGDVRREVRQREGEQLLGEEIRDGSAGGKWVSHWNGIL